MPLNPAPFRVNPVTFPTPNVNDILFFESIDVERIGTNVPEYGTPHPDYKKWPNHRLVFIQAADDENRFYRFYYAADQIGQDDDNWAFSEADIGGTKFDAVVRKYVVRRSEFTPDSPAMGSIMPDEPQGKFDGVYVLAQREQQEVGEQVLNGLYVLEQRVYVKKVTLSSFENEERFGGVFRTTTTLYYRGETVGGTAIETLFANASNPFWDTQSNGAVRKGDQISDNWFSVAETVYEAPAVSGAGSNPLWTFTQADIGGTSFDAIAITQVKPKAGYSATSPTMGTPLAAPPLSTTGTYVLAERTSQPTGNQMLDKLFVVEQLTYVRKTSVLSIDFDEYFRTANKTTQLLFYRSEIPTGQTNPIEVLSDNQNSSYWGLQSDGILRTAKQLTTNWWRVVEQEVVNMGGAATATFQFETSVNYQWPAVLGTIFIDEWPQRNGAVARYPRIKYTEEGYSGPCRAVVTVKWKKTPHVVPAVPEPPMPIPIVMATPLFSLSVPASLHGAISINVTTGNEDPEYEYVAGTFTFDATNYPSWSPFSASGLLVKADHQPFRGGWLLEETRVFPPT